MLLNNKVYPSLLEHYQKMKLYTLNDLFKQNQNRVSQYHLKVNDINLDFSKNNINDDILHHLIQLALNANLPDAIENMFTGQKINITEQRAVLHTALRTSSGNVIVDGKNVIPEIQHILHRMQQFSEKIHNGSLTGYTGKKITDIVNIGIGGSDLGPSLLCDALKPYKKSHINIHFVSSIDGYAIVNVLNQINHETTLFVIASKTFTTQETLINANTARKWFLDQTQQNIAAIKHHFVAASSNAKAVTDFGIDINNMFEFWDFVGGRYSLWSSISLAVILYIGFDNFNLLLCGAHDMDVHFRSTTDLRNNMPVILALLGIWYINFYNYNTHIISPYNIQLKLLPQYIQQLDMESNGKSVDIHGNRLNYATSPVIWGGSGINGQHAYYQLLHQGTNIYPMDIIIAENDQYIDKQHHMTLQVNAIAQAEAFMIGKTYDQAIIELLQLGISEHEAHILAKHKVFIGNRPTNFIKLKEISPYNLGGLLALYEHKTFVQGIIWGINSFDQWGVELGKQLAQVILLDIKHANSHTPHDASTAKLIQELLQHN